MSDERAGNELPDDDDDLPLDELLGTETDDESIEDDTDEIQQTPLGTPTQLPIDEPRRPSARQRQILRARERERQKDEEIAQLRRQVEQIMVQTRQPTAPAPDPYRQAELDRQEQERVAMMAPHEVAAYYANKSEQRVAQQLLRTEVGTRDLIDRQMYEQLKGHDRLAERYADQVENLLVAARNQGMNPSREILLNALVGQEVRKKARAEAEKTRRRGARQIAAQTTTPGGGRSSTPAQTARRGSRDDSDEAVDARLRGVTIGQARGLGLNE